MKKENELNLEQIKTGDEVLKSLFMYAYYKVKASNILDAFRKALSSRDKDEECYRWKFAENEALLYETALIEHRMGYLKEQLKSATKTHIPALSITLESTKENYDNHVRELERICDEKAQLLVESFDFSDLNLDFIGIMNAYKLLDDETKQRIKSIFAGNAIIYNVDLNKTQPTGASMGE